ncbi:MAG: hypothetical protein QG619_923 [Pseudomonadota bacterium]|nr:hypothetical protein [Pseudomonadota bacterium]
MNITDITGNSYAAAKWAAVPHKHALLACESGAQFMARFKNAPEWVLVRIEACLSQMGYINWATDKIDYPPSWVRQVREQKAAEKAAAEFQREHPSCPVGYNRLVEAALRGPIKIGDGPTVENWDFADQHPGNYTDSAWSSSKEVQPGVWAEARHGINSGTHRWTIINIDAARCAA